MPVFASLSIAASTAVASLNLCSDEYLLLLARPGEVASVTHLARDPDESPLWRQARRHPANRGSLEDALAAKPTVVLTMAGGGGRATATIARRLGLKVVDLPSPSSIDDVVANLRTTATMLGEPHRADPWIARIRRLQANAPRRTIDTFFLSGGGITQSAGSLGAQWMRLVGLAQRALPGGRADLETLLTRPPALLLRSTYRAGQASAGQRWLSHPIVKRLPTRLTDGRRWTCSGPLMIAEIERLQGLAR